MQFFRSDIRLLMILTCIASLWAIPGCGSSQPSTGEFHENLSYSNDFGIVPILESRSSEIRVSNPYSFPVTIKDIRSSCGCTVAKASKTDLDVNESTTLNVRFTAGTAPANVHGSIYLAFDQPDLKGMQIHIFAQVRQPLNIVEQVIEVDATAASAPLNKWVNVENYTNSRWKSLDVQSDVPWISVVSTLSNRGPLMKQAQDNVDELRVLETWKMAITINQAAVPVGTQMAVLRVAAVPDSAVVKEVPSGKLNLFIRKHPLIETSPKLVFLGNVHGDQTINQKVIAWTARQSDQFGGSSELTATLRGPFTSQILPTVRQIDGGRWEIQLSGRLCAGESRPTLDKSELSLSLGEASVSIPIVVRIRND